MSLTKILLITSEFPPNVGGIGNHAYNVATYLQKSGYQVTVIGDLINIDKNVFQTFKDKNAFEIIPVNRGKIILVSYLKRIVNALKYASKNDIVICSGKFSLWLIQIVRLWVKNRKYIAVVHGSELLLTNEKLRSFTNASLNKFNTIIAVSSFTKSLLSKDLQLKAIVIPNGINNDEFIHYQNSTKEKIDVSNGIHLITVGSVTERKGQENVIKALPEIKKVFPQVHYHIVGKPFIQQQLTKLIESLSLQNIVTFYGAVSRADLIKRINNSHIKLMLSNNTTGGDVEGFGIAVLEANALGKPAIGSNNNGIVDAIVTGETGELVNSKNPVEIANAVKKIITNYAEYSLSAKSWALQHDWRHIIQQYIIAIEKA